MDQKISTIYFVVLNEFEGYLMNRVFNSEINAGVKETGVIDNIKKFIKESIENMHYVIKGKNDYFNKLVDERDNIALNIPTNDQRSFFIYNYNSRIIKAIEYYGEFLRRRIEFTCFVNYSTKEYNLDFKEPADKINPQRNAESLKIAMNRYGDGSSDNQLKEYIDLFNKSFQIRFSSWYAEFNNTLIPNRGDSKTPKLHSESERGVVKLKWKGQKNQLYYVLRQLKNTNELIGNSYNSLAEFVIQNVSGFENTSKETVEKELKKSVPPPKPKRVNINPNEDE